MITDIKIQYRNWQDCFEILVTTDKGNFTLPETWDDLEEAKRVVACIKFLVSMGEVSFEVKE